MATETGGLVDVSDLQKSSKSATPPLEQNPPLRKFVHSAQRQLTRAFAREENMEVPKITDTGQPVVQHREVEDEHRNIMEIITRPTSV